jgi:hypothetical protein
MTCQKVLSSKFINALPTAQKYSHFHSMVGDIDAARAKGEKILADL